MQELKQRIERVADIWGPQGSNPSEMIYTEEMGRIKKDIVDFHGEMVLLMNYSNVNYTGPNLYSLAFCFISALSVVNITRVWWSSDYWEGSHGFQHCLGSITLLMPLKRNER